MQPLEGDRAVGELFRRLSIMRVELGEPAWERTVGRVLAALGAAALEEAERRGRIVAAREATSASTVRVTAFARRLAPEPLDEGN
ncbi:hypothetical protein [Methylobacterium sp. J-092]|uniref:hypothetical protein n=1 Tax=Methylobacterium sp. J-092 TaxID=2836667 RepID=UPI001FBA3673|nr:hypothetical protein [Methylobacterium sp. J-092]MCJ2009581.1 hypothetical protein [Methylobacterium sp. J-092]